ncbi:MBL fold metallo-hydrolase [Oceanobacillus polygoni]|uniref:Ribonuclease BN (tRNA processing enzyme) n=1 Tax=Oceanobacillus polygoni TaxID=1235259 RepID=A0A9X0YNX5_9BACI|nr:MBL fold metallo-hydrolase [Oceanobacillus polygoni]MBP2076038.1 ribonuclease BN (tRNA processing enzyme) [Oceanobacillus polygoni]
MLGTGSPRPDLERSGPAQVLHINSNPILIDCGEGTTTQLLKANIPPENVNVLMFTHLHSDHFFGYGQFLLGGWGRGRRKLTVVGPKGIREFHETVINMYKDDIAYRVSLGRPENGVLDVKIIEFDQAGEIHVDIPAKVTAKEMVHNVPTFGYRFEIDDMVIVFSGDTAPTPNIVELAREADVLVLDAALSKTGVYRDTKDPELLKIWENLQKEHCTPEQAGNIAQEAGAKKLVMTHFLPNVIPEEVKEEAEGRFTGESIVAEDLMEIYI